MLSSESILPLRALEMSRRAYHQRGERGAFEGLKVQLVNGTVVPGVSLRLNDFLK
ncbi:MAG: hypothetical protein GQE15_37165 [Archangiaceae bacterium]|nr:hypothetical protein [Archangiaceae bacterium]